MKADDRLLELVSAAADGEIDAADRAELDRLMADSEEARAFQADIERLDHVFRAIPPIQPPPSLRARVLDSIEIGKGAASRQRANVIELLFGAPVFRYALAASAGALVVLGVQQLGDEVSEPGNIEQMVGAMAPAEIDTVSDLVDSLTISEASFDSVVQLRQRDGRLILDIRISAQEPLEIVADLTAANQTIDAVAQFDTPAESIEFSGQTLRVRGHGDRRLSVLLRRKETAPPIEDPGIVLRFMSDNRLLRQGRLKPGT